MATRSYRRDKSGKFAGAGKGTRITVGKAGGFANAAFRQRVQANRSLGGAAGTKGSKPSRNSNFRHIVVSKVEKAAKSKRVQKAVITGAVGAVGVGIATRGFR